jgi:hypothetical protein
MLNFLRKTALWILLAPAVLFGTGVASNQLVLFANHDTFPVSINPVKLQVFTGGVLVKEPIPHFEGGVTITLLDGTVMMDDTHVVMSSKTHLNWLADVFDMHSTIYSIGDFMLMLAEWLWAFAPFVWAFEVIRRLKQE